MCSVYQNILSATVSYLEEVNKYPLIPPNVDSATEIGITHENIPSSFCPNV